MDKGRDKTYCRHILEAISLIEEFIAGKVFEDFQTDKMLISAVTRQMEIIGEASKRLSEEFKDEHGQIPWIKISGMRDFLIHDYMMVDLREVWNAATRDIKELKQTLKEAQN